MGLQRVRHNRATFTSHTLQISAHRSVSSHCCLEWNCSIAPIYLILPTWQPELIIFCQPSQGIPHKAISKSVGLALKQRERCLEGKFWIVCSFLIFPRPLWHKLGMYYSRPLLYLSILLLSGADKIHIDGHRYHIITWCCKVRCQGSIRVQ